MPKPIGNLSANLKTNDKVGYRTKNRFAAKALLPVSEAAAAAAKPVVKPVKYKSRKK